MIVMAYRHCEAQPIASQSCGAYSQVVFMQMKVGFTSVTTAQLLMAPDSMHPSLATDR
jgi:hypothetical protein